MALRSMRVWRYIDEVAKAGSVRQAAERVNITPSALLRRLQDVEHDIGAPIFERHNSGMRLTAAGELLMHWVRNQDAELRRVYSRIGELSGLQYGEVTIACSQASQIFIAREVNRFRRAHPRIRFSIMVMTHEQAVRAVLDCRADLAVMFKAFESADIETLASVSQRLLAVMAHDHPLAAQPTVSLAECGQYDVALSGAALGGRLEGLLRSKVGTVNIGADYDSFAMLPELIEGTQMIGFHIDLGVIEWRGNPKLALRPLTDIDRSQLPVILGQLKGRPLPTAAFKFAEQLKDELRALDARIAASDPEEI